jgi:hypothetical protein
VLSGRQRSVEDIGAHVGRRSVEEHGICAVAQGRIEIRCPGIDAIGAGDVRKPCFVAPDQHQFRHDGLIADPKSAFLADRGQRIGKVLEGANTPGGAIDDDADFALRHLIRVRIAAIRGGRFVPIGLDIRTFHLPVLPCFPMGISGLREYRTCD